MEFPLDLETYKGNKEKDDLGKNILKALSQKSCNKIEPKTIAIMETRDFDPNNQESNRDTICKTSG